MARLPSAILWKLTYAYPRLVLVTASRQTRILATGPILLNNSKSIASVTLGSSSPTYKLAEGDAPVAVEADALPPYLVPSSPSPGDGDSLGDGAALDVSSPLVSEGAASDDVSPTTAAGFSSFVEVATGELVSPVDIMSDDAFIFNLL